MDHTFLERCDAEDSESASSLGGAEQFSELPASLGCAGVDLGTHSYTQPGCEMVCAYSALKMVHVSSASLYGYVIFY